MRCLVRKGIVSLAIACIVIIVLPTIVSAETQQQITEVAQFAPYEDNNTEVDNIANDTITYNYQTWDPLPSGLFVGGSIRESLMEIPEYAVGIPHGVPSGRYWSEMLLAQPIKFPQDYLMSGASDWVVRVPLSIDSEGPFECWFYLYKINSPTDYQILRTTDWYYGLPLGYSEMQLMSFGTNGADLETVVYGLANLSRTSSTEWSYVRDGRLYYRFTAPIKADEWYLATCHVFFKNDTRFRFYLSPADLASDNVTASTLAYSYYPAVDQNVTKQKQIPADLGFSFVFQTGLGISGTSLSRLYGADDELRWSALVNIPSWYQLGYMNFVMEFRVNSSQTLHWGIQVNATVRDSGSNASMQVLDHAYWTGKEHNSLMVASTDQHNYTGISIGGLWYVLLEVSLFIEDQQRVTIMMADNGDTALYNHGNPFQVTWHFTAAGHNTEMLFFEPWTSISIDDKSLNWTAGVPINPHHVGFWQGLSNWFDKHWIDIVAIELIAIGVLLLPFTLGGSLLLIGAGLHILLYDNWAAYRGFIDKAVKFVLDGLSWLGNWLYKIGVSIWTALTWFVDQIVSYGAILIGLLIVGVAIALVVFPLKWEIGILSSFESLVQGDTERARAQFEKTSSEMKRTASTITRGRV